MLDWSPEDILHAVRDLVTRKGDAIDFEALQADLDEALGLLRAIATHRDRDGEVVCAGCDFPPDEHFDCGLASFLARHPAPEVGS